MLRKLYLRQTDETETSYLKFCKKLTQGGIVRAVHKGPQDFAVRAAAKQPKNTDTIHRISTQ
ncbi:MAG TPA: DUF4129 domain-containing protein [Gallionellaceae bacterium]|nr:DUF4129 domain-containing protein [Gallionellaceae bacterium]